MFVRREMLIRQCNMHNYFNMFYKSAWWRTHKVRNTQLYEYFT